MVVKNERTDRKNKIMYLLLAVLLDMVWNLWDLWYYGGLYRKGELLSAAGASMENLGTLLCQHGISVAPVLVIAIILVVKQRKDFFEISSLTLGSKRGRICAGLAGAVYLFLLVAGILWGSGTWFAILYQWGYYLFFVALMEEIFYRAWLPYLMQQSSLPEWCVWVIPGVLFGCAHMLMPIIKEGFGFSIIEGLAASVTGYLAGACGFYALRRWSGTLWLPVLLHAAMDFTGVFAS